MDTDVAVTDPASSDAATTKHQQLQESTNDTAVSTEATTLETGPDHVMSSSRMELVDTRPNQIRNVNTDAENPPHYSAEPPSYNSLFGRVKSIRSKPKLSEENDSALTRILMSKGCMLTLGGLGLFQAAHIVIGFLYLHNCRLEGYIPIYLIVVGIFTMLQIVIFMVMHHRIRRTGDEEDTCYAVLLCCTSIIVPFLFTWFVAGSRWMFGPWTTWNTDISLPTYCDTTLYLYAFWTTMFVYICLGIVVLVACGAFCVSVFKEA